MLAFHYGVYLDYEPVRDTNLACVFAVGRGEVRILQGNQRQNHSSFHVALISTIEDMGREKNPSYEMRQGAAN